MIEIDFLRTGTRYPTEEKLPNVPYFVFLCRAKRRKDVEVWPIPLDQPLPEVTVPLIPGDAEVKLDLQKALGTIYDIIGYDELMDYTLPPPGRLSADQLTWIDERLKRARVRNSKDKQPT